ncbi:hypothetical protein WOLCODRAFT_140528 [Wolfiporia cocos MD-104 SS10]|uniref:Uncharacterized protein n=1 Tax=Wolfiporia cocos (strain MD-104) TaxID=742152 RepID=A0A2H3JCZ8_WOLCO|nr:hypothetical protein WOLCODRAFT_140528 [Wolfiporia cocos MD-104 SS10]
MGVEAPKRLEEHEREDHNLTISSRINSKTAIFALTTARELTPAVCGRIPAQIERIRDTAHP